MNCHLHFAAPVLFVLVHGCLSAVAGEAAPRFRTSGKQLLLDGEPFRIKSVCYQPLLPGQTLRSPLDEEQIRRDLAMIARSGANTLRVYPQPIPGEGRGQRLPRLFYDLARQFDLWVIRDIFIDVTRLDFLEPSVIEGARRSIHRVIDEVFEHGGEDRVLAWEFGNEFSPLQVSCTNNPQYGCLDDVNPAWPAKPTSFAGTYVAVSGVTPFEALLASLAEEIKMTVREEKESSGTSILVTWAAWPAVDPIRTEFWFNAPAPAAFLDFVSYNAYTFWPDRLRVFNPGSVTGTPYQGYLEFLTSLYPDRPLFVSEVGLPNSSRAVPEAQAVTPPLDPAYRRGGLSHEHMAQGLENTLLDVLLTDGVIGASVFEWNDEWHKIVGSEDVHDDDPEEYFGLLAFDEGIEGLKPAFDAVRRVFSLDLNPAGDGPVISSVRAAALSLQPSESTAVSAEATSADGGPLEYRWFASRGRILGGGSAVTYVAPPVSLGPGTITLVVTDAQGRAARERTEIVIRPDGEPVVTIDSCGSQRAGGRVRNVDLAEMRLAVYVRTDAFYAQPWADAPFVEVAEDGTWSTFVHNWPDPGIPGDPRPQPIWAVLVSRETQILPRAQALPASPVPPASRAVNDRDGPVGGGDLLPDEWETTVGLDPTDPGDGTAGTDWAEGPQGDPDADGLVNLEEFRLGKDPRIPDNDEDGDGLPDNWERRYLGSLDFDGGGDPDGDGVSNADELSAFTSPVKEDHDRDRDGLPDAWEDEHFGGLVQEPDADLDSDGLGNLDEYRNLTRPASRDTDRDGMDDGFEVLGKLQPLLDDAREDPDGDSYTNLYEFICHGRPAHARNPFAGGPPCRFIRGDATADRLVNISDAIVILGYLFLGGTVFCKDAADVDDSGATNVTDAIFLLNYLFQGGPPPDAPFPETGLDPSEDSLSCGE